MTTLQVINAFIKPNKVAAATCLVIASEARQSSSTLGTLDCRVASLLAMTGGECG
jgi:hypothetical protein